MTRLKFALSALLAGALMLVHPDVSFGQNRGGGGSRAGVSRGGGGGARSFSGQRGSSGAGSFSGGRSFSSGGRAFSNQRGFVSRGGAFYGYYGGPYRYGYGYYPGYSYYGYYGAYCNPNGYYDAWGRWYPDPRCGYSPYAPNYYGY